jgi:hypothetical protein
VKELQGYRESLSQYKVHNCFCLLAHALGQLLLLQLQQLQLQLVHLRLKEPTLQLLLVLGVCERLPWMHDDSEYSTFLVCVPLMWALHYDHAIAVDFQNSGLVVQIYNHVGICLFETYARFCVWSCYLFEILFMIVLCYYSRCWFPYTRESKSRLDAQGKPYEIQSNSWWKISFWTGVASLHFLDPPYLMMNPCINSHWVQSQYCWSETESWFESRWADSGFSYGLAVIPFVLAELKF